MFIQVDPAACTGCRACEVFCSLEQEGLASPAQARIRVQKDEPNNVCLPVVCPPCANKACMAACTETGAMIISPQTGAVLIVQERCTGCSKCIAACDIGAIRLIVRAGSGKHGKAAAVKCNQCGGEPWCVRVCEPGALQYVDEESGGDGQAVFERLRAGLAQAEPVMAARGAVPRRRARVP